MLQVGVLGATVALIIGANRVVRPAIVVAAAVAFGLVTGAVRVGDAGDAVRDLAGPLGFLVAAVPLAMLLGAIGFFDAVAARVAVGHRLRPTLWAFAAIVTTLFNLDASIVLLTPLYLRIARRHGLDPLATAFQPVLLASLASSALPVSNLTNLIVAERIDASALDFVVRLGPPSLAATLVGWMAYRRWLGDPTPVVLDADDLEARDERADRRALRIGLPAVLALLVGFTVGDVVGVPPWAVAAAVAIALAVAVRRVPWRAVPVEAVVVGAGLAVLAAAAAPHLGLERALGGSGIGAEARVFAAGVLGANAVNNLPALLVGLPDVEPATVWAFLMAVNVGPVLWLSGSLAGLLWLDLVRREGYHVTFGQYARVGVRVGGPALLAAGVLVLLTGRW